MQQNLPTPGQPGTQELDWKSIYSKANLNKLGVPAFAHEDANEGVFRQLLLQWEDIPTQSSDGTEQLYQVICCDVLKLDRSITLEKNTFVFARRLEVGAKGRVVVNKIDAADMTFQLVTQEIVEPATNLSRDLPLTIAALDENGEPFETLTPLHAAYRKTPARGFRINSGESHIECVSPAAIADTFLRQGEQLPLSLHTQFVMATLYFTEQPQFVLPILAWISRLLVGSAVFSDLSAQARSFHDTVLQLAGLDKETLLVPQLDHSIYASTARDCLEYLKSREQRYRDQLALKDSHQNWQESIRLALDDKENDVSLNLRLEDQARMTRDQAGDARSMATRLLIEESTRMSANRIRFERGIKEWKEKKIRDAVFDIVSESISILLEIPAIVSAGPVGAAVTLDQAKEAIASAVELARHLTQKAPDLSKPDRQGLLIDDSDAVDSERDDEFPDEDSFDIDSFDESSVEIIIPKDDSAESKDWLDKSKKQDDETKKTLKERKKKQKELFSSLKSASKGAKGIFDAAMQINKICANAEKMEAASRKILTEVESGVGVSLGSIAPVGIDVVTGGAEKWELLANEIENIFETLPEEVISIGGGNEFRQGFRKLLIHGQAMSEARLALAKANTDLAVATLRRQSAEQAVALYEQRLKTLNNAVIKDGVLEQLTFQRMLEAKRSVFLALEAYRRAFMYFTLAPKAKTPGLPKMTDSVDQFAKAMTTLTGKELVSSTLASISGIPGTLNGVEVVVSDPTVISELRENNFSHIVIPTGEPAFRDLNRVRLLSMRVYLEGAETRGNIEVSIDCSGNYQDQMQHNNEYTSLHFVSRPTRKKFVYQPGREEPIIKADIAERYLNDFFRPTPFTSWRIEVASRDNSVLDLTNLRAARMVFYGEYSA